MAVKLLTDDSKALIRERIDRVRDSVGWPHHGYHEISLYYCKGIVSVNIESEDETHNLSFAGVELAYALAYAMGLGDALEVCEGEAGR